MTYTQDNLLELEFLSIICHTIELKFTESIEIYFVDEEGILFEYVYA